MAHVRQQIRAAVATLLEDLPTSGENVFSSRRLALQENELPAIAIYTGDEVSESATKRPVQLHRRLELHVECIGLDADDEALEDDLDTMAAEVEAALGASPTLGDLVKNCVLAGINPVVDSESGTPLGRHRLTFHVEYVTAAADSETAL